MGYAIPPEVVEQWIYPHYYNLHTVTNYGWIDYRHVESALSAFSIQRLLCTAKDLEHRKRDGFAPTEQVFSKLKTRLRRLQPRTRSALGEVITKGV